MVCFSITQLTSQTWVSTQITHRLFSLSPSKHHSLQHSNPISRANPFLYPSFRPSKIHLSTSCSIQAAKIAERAVTLREICEGRVPQHIIQRQVHQTEEVGFVAATDVQRKSLPILLSGRDCILHAQTGSGKTLAYLLLIFSVIDAQRSAVQALIVVPSRELGMQVTKVARFLAARPLEHSLEKTCTVMALLDGGMLKRHKSWLKAEPPEIVVATIGSLCQMLEKQIFKLDAVRVLVIDEVCSKHERLHTLLSLLETDAPKSGIIFVSEQSEKSKKAGNPPPTTSVIEFLERSFSDCSEILLLEEEMNFNARAASLYEVRQGGCLLVATDLAGRGVDLPETTHIYNFHLPKNAINYLHRAGRTGRKPFSDEKCTVTNIIAPEERFVLQRFENELNFHCEELCLD
ncbi:P-loop containing nucleoside triphosphate hydrolases superfamily protein isoform X3 [Tasmannia lanceolata]|uniref:P-loop containing nucleoside triphosphate hydrolases superfamily protein isoform X3 n=1 Tax=Tasmannia lanceolata TaxID=3420 RepID=UPI00406328EC